MLKLCEQNIKNLLPCEPFKVKESKIIGKDLHIYFEHTGEHEVCPECGEHFQIHQWREIILAGPSFGLHKRSYWHVKYCVYRCNDCDYHKSQDIPFRFEKTSCTTYLAKQICDDLDIQNETITAVCKRYNLKWWFVRNIHKTFLQKLSSYIPNPQPPEIAVVDEFSIEKNHKYATLVLDAQTKFPLYLHKGNAAQDFEPFFFKYSKSFYKHIKAFAMDQNASYSSVVKEYLPKCVIVCDYFHIIKNFNENVIERVRKRTLRHSHLFMQLDNERRLKGAKRLLSKRFSQDIDEEQWSARLSLQVLLAENRELDTCIHMREQLQALYDNCIDEKTMEKRFDQWCLMAKESGIPELMAFANSKQKVKNEIINHAKFAISSGVIEGCMNKIKVLKRVCFGFRDMDYFFLRIWTSFLPNEMKTKYTNLIWNDIEQQEAC